MNKCVWGATVVVGILFCSLAWGEAGGPGGKVSPFRIDCNDNGIEDACDLDCGPSGGPCDVPGCGESEDCNANGVPDECDIADEASDDCQPDGVPDECQLDDVTIIPEYGPSSPSADNGEAWGEDFETYAIGPIYINGWYGWGIPTYSGVSPVTSERNHTPGGGKSMKLTVQETIRLFEGYDYAASSAWVLTTWVYVPQGMTGTADYRVQSEYDGAFTETLAVRLVMNPASGLIRHVGANQTLPLIVDEWVEIRTEIDFERDFAAVYYGGTLLATRNWTVGGGPLNIAGVEFWSWTSDGCYFDDLSLRPARAITTDCNDNGIPDDCDIAGAAAEDCNENLIPDECEADEDCQPNGIQDICEVSSAMGEDCNDNHIPDDCEPDADCNGNSIQDICDIAEGTSTDCNSTRIPDECELTDNDCNGNGTLDECDVMGGLSEDCNENLIPDECEIVQEVSEDCQPDGVPDECQLDGVLVLPQYEACSVSADFGSAWCDDFESYEVGSIGGLNGWEGFGGSPTYAGDVSAAHNHTPGGSQSLHSGGDDTLRVFHRYEPSISPAWVLRAWVFLPASMDGPAFFMVDSEYDGTVYGDRNPVKLLMDPNVGLLSDWLTGEALPLIQDEWVEIRVLVDFERDLVATYYDDVLLNVHAWSHFGCAPAIAAVHLLTLSSSGYYCDDVSLYPAAPYSTDCNENLIPDVCDIGDMTAEDCNENLIPDGCEPYEDCNDNGVQDICDLALGTSLDCNSTGIPDECELEDNDCNSSGVPDECELEDNDCNSNSVPDECDIDSGLSSDINENGIPDECECAGPGPEPGGPPCSTPGDCVGAYEGADCVGGVCYIPKNRYLTIDPTANFTAVAYQVEIAEAADYPSAVGRTWWLDEPVCYDYPNGEPVTPAPETCAGADRFGWVSGLVSTPVTRVWTEEPLHITGCGIAPVVTYQVWASADQGASFSPTALVVGTIHRPEGEAQRWGDITGGPAPGIPGAWLPPERTTNFADIGNAIRTFENRIEDTGFPPRVWVDVEINQVINMADVSFLIAAFETRPYADINLPLIGIDPVDCP